MYDFTNNSKVALEAAEEGIVLLKNEKCLPLKESSNIGILNIDSLKFIMGGGGSADVNSIYSTTFVDALKTYLNNSQLDFIKENIVFLNNYLYSVELLNNLSKKSDTFIFTIKRYSSEGRDRTCVSEINTEDITGDVLIEQKQKEYNTCYSLTTHEKKILELAEKSEIKNVIVIANVAGLIDFSFINKYKKIKAVLLLYLPGMRGEEALANILFGKVNPSGRLVDTVAKQFQNYPSSATFSKDKENEDYIEDIFVGYRYFETNAKEEVIYPFGYGLSYTKFSFSILKCIHNRTLFDFMIRVKNIGNVSGKEVLQMYIEKPKSRLIKPKIELCGFVKTSKIEINQNVVVHIRFDLSDIASYDQDGVTGNKNCFILEKGKNIFRIGENIRETKVAYVYDLAENYIIEKTIPYISGEKYIEKQKNQIEYEINPDISIKDVETGTKSINQFLAKFSNSELIELAQGQLCGFPFGTSGIGNLEKYDIPNIQTGDGPAGFRKATPTTCFPCGTLLASTWNLDLINKVGKALGDEGIHTNVDVILAPSINIHRNPLCGRNFEYYSEDPILAGECAVAMVKGIQSEGLLSCVKHFFANNSENNRMIKSSNLSERAAREIYLRAFKIVIQKANPSFLMTSYNLFNHRKCSTDSGLLKGILRDEWGYTGTVMTDWRNTTHLWEEIVNGNNLKMPLGYPDERDMVLQQIKKGNVFRNQLVENAAIIIKSIMRSWKYSKSDFGYVNFVEKNGITNLPFDKLYGISGTFLRVYKDENDRDYLYNMAADQRKYPMFIVYKLFFENYGKYIFECKIKNDTSNIRILLKQNDKIINSITILEKNDSFKSTNCSINVTKGECLFSIMVVADPNEKYIRENNYTPKENISISDISIKYIGQEK